MGETEIGLIGTDKTKDGFITTFFPHKGIKGPRITEAESTSLRETVKDRRRLGDFAKTQLSQKSLDKA